MTERDPGPATIEKSEKLRELAGECAGEVHQGGVCTGSLRNDLPKVMGSRAP